MHVDNSLRAQVHFNYDIIVAMGYKGWTFPLGLELRGFPFLLLLIHYPYKVTLVDLLSKDSLIVESSLPFSASSQC